MKYVVFELGILYIISLFLCFFCYIVYNHTNELGISLVQNIYEMGI